MNYTRSPSTFFYGADGTLKGFSDNTSGLNTFYDESGNLKGFASEVNDNLVTYYSSDGELAGSSENICTEMDVFE